MEKIILPKIKEEIIDNRTSRFIIEPLFPGYGATLGNALRRILLSSIPGAAITSFKINGVSHEFSAIPHIKEDVVEILLNLKGINILSHSKQPVVLKISKKGPCEVTASDFSKNSNIEIVDKNNHIASLDNKANLDMEVTVEYDRGFRSTEDNTASRPEIGQILIDASFSPIERVQIEYENTRVGRMTNYDKILLQVHSNGTIKAKDAIIDASNILIDHFKEIAFQADSAETLTIPSGAEEDINAQVQLEPKKIETEFEKAKPDSKLKLDEVGFSPRTVNALMSAGVKTLAGLKRLSSLKLSEIRGLGQKGIAEIKEKLSK